MEGGREGGKEGRREGGREDRRTVGEAVGFSCLEAVSSRCFPPLHTHTHTHPNTHTHPSSGTWARGQVIQWMAASQGGLEVSSPPAFNTSL